MKCTIIGSLNYDLVTFTNKIPAAGETFKANSFETHIGGKGLNQCIATAKLLPKGEQSSVRLIGNVGKDSFGSEIMQELKAQGINTSEIGILEGVSTGVASIIVEASGQNRILITAGANGHTTYNEPALEGIFTSNEREYVIFQNEVPHPETIINWLHEKRPNKVKVYNPSPFDESFTSWQSVDVLIVNEIEVLQVAGLPQQEMEIQEYTELAIKLQKQISQQTLAVVVVTLGALGAVYASKDGSGFIEPVKVDKVVDTTAAGDTFLGGVVAQLAQDIALPQALRFATVASSLTIQQSGAAESIPLAATVGEYL